MTLRKDLIRIAHKNPGKVRDALLPLLKEAAPSGPKVTIYHKAAIGLAKIEGFLTSVEKSGVNFIPKRGRRERMIMTYYSPFIMVVEGWNKPNPESAWEEEQAGAAPGVTTQKSRYRSTDPRWVSDFMEVVGKRLRPIVLFESGNLKFDRSGLTAKVAADVPKDVTKFLADVEKAYRKYFKKGYFASRAGTSLGKNSIYIATALLPKGKQSHGIIQNDPSYNTFWIHEGFTDEGLNARLKLEMSQGNKLYGPNASNAEMTGWRNGTAKPAAIVKKFDKYFKKLRSMVDARDDLPKIV